MRNILTRGVKIALFSAAALLMAMPVFSQATLREAMDFDGDSKADYAVFRPDNNFWYINNSLGGFTATNFGIASSDFMTPGDYDGDNKADISVFRDTDGIWYRFNSMTQTFSGVQWGLTGDEPVARDYDGDGKTDVSVARRTGGAIIWFILRSTDGGATVYQWGLSTDYSAPGDYDGDGKFDVCIQRPGATPTSQATFYAQKSSVLPTVEAIVQPWGFSNDLVVPGDYDGDGKTDFAVVREGSTPTSNLSWFILRSSDFGIISSVFGVTGSDLNVQGDYDGDGKTDVAVWRDTTGTFYVEKSTGGFIQLQWGQASDYPVASYDTH